MKKILIFITLISFSMNAQLKTVTYTDGTQKLEGFFAKATAQNPKNIGIIVLPAWMGIDDHSKESAEALAALGYHAFVADIYGVGNKPNNTTEAGKLSGYFKNSYKDYQRRIQLAIDQLVKQGANPDEIAVIGYCFGGTGAIETARGNMKVKGVVSFHGGLGKDPMRQTDVITSKVLVLHGADDPYVPQKEVLAFQDEMKIGKAVWQMNFYSNAVHAFTHKELDTDTSKGAAYNELADKRSWQAMKDFFIEIFN
ncbi:dienelactone hydrolase family protein [Flavobacterium jejuense]|uniref:Dienelactone hydrolase family protein n=1 Tax=Flavobacterium jejuense TaxID=1544455 RepID=A0ABX0IUY3_9FLAO|nr:dienelactone hydrolase family protein [Flavobacterium jejuense]NHN27719.1 dienelactone hydrolase family protein [Flavobacterium jejuense]